MALISNLPHDIEQFVGEQMAAPTYFPPFTVASKPSGGKFRYRAIYITDSSKPAWMDVDGVWRYADGSVV